MSKRASPDQQPLVEKRVQRPKQSFKTQRVSRPRTPLKSCASFCRREPFYISVSIRHQQPILLERVIRLKSPLHMQRANKQQHPRMHVSEPKPVANHQIAARHNNAADQPMINAPYVASQPLTHSASYTVSQPHASSESHRVSNPLIPSGPLSESNPFKPSGLRDAANHPMEARRTRLANLAPRSESVGKRKPLSVSVPRNRSNPSGYSESYGFSNPTISSASMMWKQSIQDKRVLAVEKPDEVKRVRASDQSN